MAWAMVIGTGISAGVAGYKAIKAGQQKRAAAALSPHNPGFTMNRGVLDNAKTLSDYYGNYQLPGYSKMLDNLNTSSQQSYEQGAQGATSGGDVLDLATKIAYGKNNALNTLGIQTAQGKQAALGDSLNANVAAGSQYQQQNEYERDMYDRSLREKAALTQAGEQNMYGAIDQLAGIGARLATGIGKGKKDSTGDDATNAAARDLYNQRYYPNGQSRFDANGNPVASVMYQGTPGSNAAYVDK